MNTSLKCLCERDHALANVPVGGPPEDDKQVSLVVTKGSTSRVLFVYWLPLKKLVGKPVTLDGEGRVQHVPNFVKSQEDFSQAEVIYPACGARMRKFHDDWEHVSETAVRLKDMFDAAFTPTTGFEDWSTNPCYVCAKGGFGSDAFMPVSKCALCLLCSHPTCMKGLVQSFPEEVSKRNKMLKLELGNFKRPMVPSSIITLSTTQKAAGKLQTFVAMLLQNHQVCCSIQSCVMCATAGNWSCCSC